MSITIKEDTDLIYSRNYKVCHYVDNKKISTNTFTNKLVNADGTHFWFSSIENGLAVVRQDMIVWMGCMDEPKKVEKQEVNCFVIKVESFQKCIDVFIKVYKKEPISAKANSLTLKNIFPNFRPTNGFIDYYNGIKLIIDNDIEIGYIKIE